MTSICICFSLRPRSRIRINLTVIDPNTCFTNSIIHPDVLIYLISPIVTPMLINFSAGNRCAAAVSVETHPVDAFSRYRSQLCRVFIFCIIPQYESPCNAVSAPKESAKRNVQAKFQLKWQEALLSP